MKANYSWKNHIGSGIRILWMPLVLGIAVFCLLSAIGNVSAGQDKESKRQVEDAIQKAVLNCYTIEGRYPATLDYVEKYYGLQIDHEKYDIFYEIFAENLMPDITVVTHQD